MKQLNDAIAREEVVVLDGSVCHGTNNDHFCERLYELRDLSEMDSEMNTSLKQRLDYIESVNRGMRSYDGRKVVSLNEVGEEIENLAVVLGTKLGFTQKQPKKREYGPFARRGEKREIIRERLQRAQELTLEVAELFKSRDVYLGGGFGIDTKCRDLLFKIAEPIAKAILPVKINSYNSHIRTPSKRIERATDEKLAVAMFCMSLFSGKKAALISSDTDFFRLLHTLPRAIGSGEFSPYNESFKKALKDNPYSFYYADFKKDTCVCRFNSLDLNYFHDFHIPRFDSAPPLSRIREEEIRQNTLNFLKEFYEYRSEGLPASSASAGVA